MNAVLLTGGAIVATVVYWAIAADAAGRRCMTIGTLPLALPAIVGSAAYAGALAGRPASAIVATAGAAVAGIVDARTGFIFDPLTVTMLLVSLVLGTIDGSPMAGLSGAVAVGGALLLLHAISSGRGLGLGDVKLGTALGVAFGVAGGLSAIALAFIIGGSYGAWLLAAKRARAGTSIRFGPFIAAGAFAVLLAPLGFRP